MRSTESAERMKLTGVYAIVHIASMKRYVGSAGVSFRNRLRQHRESLKRGKHHSVLLQRAWGKYGEGAFEWRIEECTRPEFAVACEQVFIDYHKSADPQYGYNIAPIAGSARGRRHSPETREKMAAARRGQKRSPESRARMSQAQRGRTVSDAARAKMSAAKRPQQSHEQRAKNSASNRGRKCSPETCARMSAANIGRKHTPESLAKIAATSRGRKHSPEQKAKRLATRLRNKLSKASALLSIIFT